MGDPISSSNENCETLAKTSFPEAYPFCLCVKRKFSDLEGLIFCGIAFAFFSLCFELFVVKVYRELVFS